MKNKFKLGGLLALLGLLSLASGTASATPIEFTFHKEGTVDASSCGWFCSTITTSGDLTIGDLVLNGFEGTMQVGGALLYGVDDSSTWSFFDTSGLNTLSGIVTGWLAGSLIDPYLLGGGELYYEITGGTGLFAGATGGGQSGFHFVGDDYFEDGKLNIDTPASVPEPGLTTLLLAGLGMVGFMAYRRRRLQSQI